MAATFTFGWGLPLVFRGRPRRILSIILAVETPFAVWLAVSLAQGLPS